MPRVDGPTTRGTVATAASVLADRRAIAPRVGEADAGVRVANPALFGGVVAFRNSFAIGETLNRNAAAAEAYLGKLCEETDRLREQPAMREPSTRAQDAAQFMAPLMDYEKPLDEPPGRLHLPDELRQRIREYGPDWLTRITDRDLAGLDFAWLRALAQFDHWTVLSAGRLRDVKADNAFQFPIPNYSSVIVWAKLRAALALRHGDLAASSAEVRHLADLIRSQQFLLSEMVAIQIYKDDARARLVAAEAGADVSGWDALDVAQLDRQRAATFASIYFTYPGVEADTVRRAMDCMPSPCSALIEGAAANRSLGSFGATDNLQVVRDLSSARGCEQALFDRVVAARQLSAGEAAEIASSELDGRIEKFLGAPR